MPFSWQLIHPHLDADGAVPCPREAPTGILPYQGRLYMFGGGTLKYGASSAQGNKATLGTLNDLWIYEPKSDRWELMEPDDGLEGFDAHYRNGGTTDGSDSGHVIQRRLGANAPLVLARLFAARRVDNKVNATLLNEVNNITPPGI